MFYSAKTTTAFQIQKKGELEAIDPSSELGKAHQTELDHLNRDIPCTIDGEDSWVRVYIHTDPLPGGAGPVRFIDVPVKEGDDERTVHERKEKYIAEFYKNERRAITVERVAGCSSSATTSAQGPAPSADEETPEYPFWDEEMFRLYCSSFDDMPKKQIDYMVAFGYTAAEIKIEELEAFPKDHPRRFYREFCIQHGLYQVTMDNNGRQKISPGMLDRITRPHEFRFPPTIPSSHSASSSRR